MGFFKSLKYHKMDYLCYPKLDKLQSEEKGKNKVESGLIIRMDFNPDNKLCTIQKNCDGP